MWYGAHTKDIQTKVVHQRILPGQGDTSVKLEGCSASWMAGGRGGREAQWCEIAKWLSWSEVKLVCGWLVVVGG